MSLQIFIGPMYAGKTTKLMHMFHNDKNKNKIIIDYEIYDTSNNITIGELENHKEVTISNVIKTKKLNNILNESYYNDDDFIYYQKMNKAQNIYINECQFFPDLKECVIIWLKQNKNIFIYGLDGDYKAELFGQTSSLIPYCSYIEKIKGTCKLCNNESLLSYRTNNQVEQFVPNYDIYIPLCFKCKIDI